MRRLPVVLVLLTLLTLSASPQQPGGSGTGNYATLKRQAEESYAEKSFARARELYAQMAKLDLPPEERRWVNLRLADTAWRSDAANPGADPSVREAARQALETIIREAGADHDSLWAQANESLGDFWWLHPSNQNIGAAQPYYMAALDWWAGSDELPLARKRYLDIVFRMMQRGGGRWPAEAQEDPSYVPREVLVNAVQIAESKEDRAHTRYLLALQLLNQYGPENVERGLELLDEVIREGKGTRWYDDALFLAAQRLASQGAVVVVNGAVTYKPDYLKALELYRRLITEFTKSETPFYDRAQKEIEQILSPSVQVMVGMTFLPQSEQEVILNWRNVSSVDLSLIAIDLTSDVRIDEKNQGNWFENIRTDGRAVVRRWTFQTNDRGDHVPGTNRIRITPRLEPGAYVIAASSAGKTSQQLLLVSDANIVTHQSGPRSDVFVSDVITGRPIDGARVRVWQQVQNDRTFSVRDGQTDGNGLARVDFNRPVAGMTLIYASAGKGRQAWLSTWNYTNYRTDLEWRIYAFTDRPAYRPEETVLWKFIARQRPDNRWVTPANQSIEYEIVNPRGEKVLSGVAKLNEYGSFWSELPLTSSMPLGAYNIRFKSGPQQQYVGDAVLFRLEEYKLPEFRVEVTTPEVDGKKKSFRLGESVEASIEASYYFGGPVANADVEAVVYARPLYRFWYPWREYPWYYDQDQRAMYGGYGQQIKRENLKTDARGRATVRVERSPFDADTVLTIVARVVDASRREVSGQGVVRVTKNRYTVLAHPRHYLHRPNEKVSVEFKALDANDQPVQTTGTVKVIRRTWQEIWIDPMGREVAGRDLERARASMVIFPPLPPSPGDPWWRPKFAGYRDEEVMTTTVTTDAKGEATFTFTPPRDGYYLVRWTSEDRDEGQRTRARDLITAETAVWVTDRQTVDLGYRTAGLEIIVDKESFRAGESAPVMIVTPASGRTVLLTASANGILDTQVLRLDGTVKLVQFAIDERHTPSFFITASSVFDRQLASDMKRIVVPPVEHFVNVEVKSDREQYEPRQEASYTVTTRDVDGKPVSAEVALAVSDESVTAIQSDLAGDPRKFFFGQDREYRLNVGASVQTQRYVSLVEYEKTLIDDRERANKRRDSDGREEKDMAADEYLGRAGAVPPAAARSGGRLSAQSLTVSAEASVMTDATNAKSVAEPGIDVQVRSDFRSTALWKPDLITGADGVARVSVKLPEALTTWRATARAVTTETQVGMGSSTVRTTMPLIVRLQAPRFFVAGDRAVVSAVINNNTGEAVRITPSLEIEGEGLARPPAEAGATSAVVVPANGESRVDWNVIAEKPGNATLRVSGRGATIGDAMERTFTVYEHGIDKLIARSGRMRGDEAIVKLDLPRDRRDTDLVVQVAPSLAVTMLDALPYLINYPYGCTEQTMSRFLPAAIVARTLAKNGLTIRDIEGRMFGGIEKPRDKNNLGLLDEVTTRSMARLYDFQHADGGWGWWKDGESDPWMTAYVVWGFAVAREGGLRVNDDAVRRAVTWLDTQLVKYEGQWHDSAWMLHGIAAWRRVSGDSSIPAPERKAFDDVYTNRERLTAYSRALLALAAHDYKDTQRAAVLVRNLEDGAKIDRTPDQSILVRGGSSTAETMATAHWGEDRFWWRWYDGPVETTAFALQALVRIDPQNRLIEPVMNWLVKNRRGAQWSNTRDTAMAVLALNDYLGVSGELGGDVAYELSVNGRVIAARTLTGADVLAAPSRFAIEPSLVRDANEIRIRRTGGRAGAPIYFAAEGRFVSLEEPVKAAGNEIFVKRDYYRLAPHPTLLKGVVYEQEPLRDNGSVPSGDRVEVVLTIETKNDYEYLILEDLKPAGLEAVTIQSGQPLFATQLRSDAVERKVAATGEKPTVVRRARTADETYRSVWVYQELRDRKVALFIDKLPQGVWEIRYTLRAEVPGQFHALPLIAQAMYVPEIRGNSDEVRVKVTE